VLGVAAARSPGFEPTAGEARAAFRRQILSYHPDVYRGDSLDAAAQTKTLVAALKAVLVEEAETTEAYVARAGDRSEDLDVFAFPETTADAAFVNPFACRGVSDCPSYCRCVDTAPFAFEARRGATDGDENGDALNGVVARFKPGTLTYAELERAAPMDDAASDMAYRLNCAVQQCPAPGALSWVTPQQGAFLERVVDDALAAAGAAALEEADATVAALLARADFENGRFAAPARRAPKRSGKWVDWY